ncbi:TetR/AcrR family transcriptional regulator [Arcicella rigui]|uniref:TetR/AcrR family transcriptional regulator n=1 Tax=Arcicella rigui TaxID=797020 RepID=A0ABU5QDV1_9BACT|nr:TetR/AcrR family transcriptional regulator [Arcicella rigui]MEA5141030.1 TetR/AcrR family transcriptional regulator [Arcicella rigui]
MTSKQIFILETAQLMFAKHGIKAVTMDDIICECGISKRTLYMYFPSKHSLIVKIVESLLTKVEQAFKICPLVSPSAIIELQTFFEEIQKYFAKLTTSFLKDSRVYFLEAYQMLISFLDSKLLPYIAQNIARGKSEYLYRQELDITASAELYVWMLKNLLNDSFLQNECNRSDFIKGLNNFFLKGLLNTYGQKMAIGI